MGRYENMKPMEGTVDKRAMFKWCVVAHIHRVNLCRAANILYVARHTLFRPFFFLP